ERLFQTERIRKATKKPPGSWAFVRQWRPAPLPAREVLDLSEGVVASAYQGNCPRRTPPDSRARNSGTGASSGRAAPPARGPAADRTCRARDGRGLLTSDQGQGWRDCPSCDGLGDSPAREDHPRPAPARLGSRLRCLSTLPRCRLKNNEGRDVSRPSRKTVSEVGEQTGMSAPPDRVTSSSGRPRSARPASTPPGWPAGSTRTPPPTAPSP